MSSLCLNRIKCDFYLRTDEVIGGTSSAASTSSQAGETEDGRRLRLMSDTELIKKHNSDVARSPLKSSEEDHSLSSFESGISPSQSYKKGLQFKNVIRRVYFCYSVLYMNLSFKKQHGCLLQ